MNFVFDPRDPLVLRDGRPAGNGADMKSVVFPWPSSISGCLRTRLGLVAGGDFTDALVASLLQVSIRGPLLVDLTTQELLLRAPADALWNEPEPQSAEDLELRRLQPAPWPAAARQGIGHEQHQNLELLGAFGGPLPRGKAASGIPAFWRWSKLAQWLTAPPTTMQVVSRRADFGPGPLERDQRTHVAIEPERQAALDGALFRTEALVFGRANQRFGLSVACDVPQSLATAASKADGVVTLGGEQRLTRLSQGGPKWPGLPDIPVGRDRVLRLVLLTPAFFDAGSLPGMFALRGGRLLAARVDRPEVISGWDVKARGPKPVRRAAPAGSVFWVRLDADTDAANWISERWFNCISDNEQDRRDGFGLCAVGVA